MILNRNIFNWLDLLLGEKTEMPSNGRSIQSIEDYLKEYNIVGIQGIDTKALIRHIVKFFQEYYR